MKIVLIHGDVVPWATHNRAIELKKRWSEYDVEIADYKHIPDCSYADFIHVLFSGGITQLKDFIWEYREKTFTTIASQRTLDLVYDQAEDLKKVFRCCKGIVAQNPKLATNLLNFIGWEYEKKVVYIPNGVDTDKFNRPFVVGYVGNDQSTNPEHKGYHLVEQACKDLGLELKAKRNGYGEQATPHDEMPDFYQQIDCLVIPSMSEGCNNPTLEALAMNIPVISTRAGIAEHLEGVFLVERNVESVKGALRKLSGRIQILEKYTWDIVARQYKNLYEMAQQGN